VVWVISPEGRALPGWPQPPEGTSSGGPFVVAPLSPNGETGIWFNNTPVFVWKLNGAVVSSWFSNYGFIHVTPADVDVSSSGLEVNIDGSYTFNDTGSLGFTYLGGRELPWSPLKIYGESSGMATAFGDLDKDGSVEMIVPSWVFGQLFSSLYCWTFPGLTFSKERFPWPMYGHDRWHTSQYGFDPDTVLVSVNEKQQLPSRFQLQQNFPNPFNPATTINFDLPEPSYVSLAIYDLLGRKVVELENGIREAGRYKIQFDASKLASGVYLYRIKAGNFVETRKLVLLK
ncbi:MAG: T9SS type A sorting domain-containing protein, partial [Bacteroidota bacterium]